MNINKTATAEPKTRNKGIIRASYAQGLYSLPATAAASGILAGMKKIGNISAEDTLTIKKSISQALTETGLRDKGVKAIFAKSKDKKNVKDMATMVSNFLLNGSSKKDRKLVSAISTEVDTIFKKSKRMKEYFSLMEKSLGDEGALMFKSAFEKAKTLPMLLQVKTASNAFYLPHAKTMVVPDKALTLSAFHEMGHALNANFSKVGSFLQKNRKAFMMAPALIATVGIFTKKKADDETPAKGIGKVTHFVKKNADKLTLAAMLPVIAEEAMATVKGNKIASKMLDKKLLNKVKASNALGLATYVITAAGMALSAKAAINLKDKIQAKHEAKVAQKAAMKASKAQG